MRCVTCGRLPVEGCNPKTHEVQHRLVNEDPVWVLEKGTHRILPSQQRREAQRV